ncbi:MAG: tetratricopeptide repeat protein [Desulfobacterota bacterium]|nr:tetratricopeptide repeat protein [Thermodesulfobacteriota bacterium]
MATKKEKKKRVPKPIPEPHQSPLVLENKFESMRYRAVLYLLAITPAVFFRTGGEFENSPKMAILQWGTAILALLSVMRGFKTTLLHWKRSPLDVPIAVFYLLCWVSLLQAANPWQGVYYLLHWGAAILFYLLLVHMFKDEREIDGLHVAVAMSMIPVGIVGILQWLVARSWIDRIHLLEQIPQMTVPAATFSNSNMVALVLAMALPLIVSALLFSHNRWIKAACWMSLLCTILLLLCTRTRGAWLAGVGVLLIMAGRWIVFTKLPSALHLPLRYYILAVLGVLVVLYFPLRSLDSGSTTLRWIWWKNIVFMIADHPEGVGLGNFKIVYPLYHRAAKDKGISPYKDWSFGESTQLTRAHNDHLQILAETGVIGFCAYLWLLGTFFMMARAVLTRADAPLQRRAFYTMLSVFAFCIVATTNFPLERAHPPFYLFMCCAAMSALYRRVVPQRAPATTLVGRIGTLLMRPADLRICTPVRQALARACLGVVLLAFLGGSFAFIRCMVLADRYFVEGLGASDRGNLSAAVQLLEKAQTTFSAWNFNIASLLGRNYTIMEQYEKAIEEYHEALRVHPNNTNALLNTGYCYLKMGRLDDAERFFKRFLAIMPDVAKGYNNLGIVYFSKRDYERAAQCYQKACELEPGYGEAHFNLGNVYRAQGKKEEALREYEEAVRVKPELHDVRTMLVNLYLDAGDFEKAEAMVMPLVQKRETEVQGRTMLGNIYQSRGLYQQALFQYLNALKRSPQDARLYYAIGRMHLYLGNNDKAEKSFAFALQHDPSMTEAATMLGQLKLQQGDEHGALDVFLSALERTPGHADLHFNAGTVYLRLNDLKNAMLHYREAIALDPSHSLAHYNLGTMLRQQGQLAEAREHFRKALEQPDEQIDVEQTQRFIAEITAKLEKTRRR